VKNSLYVSRDLSIKNSLIAKYYDEKNILSVLVILIYQTNWLPLMTDVFWLD
jgi:hypothetical protein